METSIGWPGSYFMCSCSVHAYDTGALFFLLPIGLFSGFSFLYSLNSQMGILTALDTLVNGFAPKSYEKKRCYRFGNVLG